MNDYVSLVWDLTCDLLHNWPLSMVWHWAVPLFFAGTAFSLARLGLRGRGLPLTSGRKRLRGWTGKIGSVLLIVFGAIICIAFVYWFCFTLYRKIAGLG